MRKKSKLSGAHGTLLRTAGPLVLVASAIAVPVGASAATPLKCRDTASVYATQADGDIVQITMKAPGGKATWGGQKVLTGRKVDGKILSGLAGRIYGITPETGFGANKWTGTKWQFSKDQVLNDSFKSFGNPKGAQFNRITTDTAGDVFLIDGNGVLRTYRPTETGFSTYAKVLADGWDKYNYLVAAGKGVLYARDAKGVFYRSQWDAKSERWISYQVKAGDNWDQYSAIFSLGADTLYGRDSDGTVWQTVFDPTNSSWAKRVKLDGLNLKNNPNLVGAPDACKTTEDVIPTRPQPSVDGEAPVAIMQNAADGKPDAAVQLAWTMADGRVMYATHNASDAHPEITAQPLSGMEAIVGSPRLTVDGKGQTQLLGRNIYSDVLTRTQTGANWDGWTNLGGVMGSDPVVARSSDNKAVVFALDAAGHLWARQERPDGGATWLLPWTMLASPTLAGTPVTSVGRDGAINIFARDEKGAVQTAVYKAGSLSAWSSLGGDGFNGDLSVVVHPGPLVRVFARAADGTVKTQRADAAGRFPGVWSPVGTTPIEGSPAAVIDPQSGQVVVMARGADQFLYRADETGLATGQFKDWALVEENPTAVLGDPAPLSFTTARGAFALFAIRNENQDVLEFSTLTKGANRRGSNGASFEKRVIHVPAAPAK